MSAANLDFLELTMHIHSGCAPQLRDPIARSRDGHLAIQELRAPAVDGSISEKGHRKRGR